MSMELKSLASRVLYKREMLGFSNAEASVKCADKI